MNIRNFYRTSITYSLVIVAAVFFALPLFWMISTSLKPTPQIFLSPPKWLPSPLIWDHFQNAITEFKFYLYFKNTLLITGLNVLAAVLVNPPIAFSFSLLRWPMRDFFFIVVLSTIMLPPQVTIIPLFVIFRNLGWLNTFLPLTVLPFFGHPIFIFLMRQFMKKIPFDLVDAARIDGCSNYRVYWNIILPLLKAPLATIAIFQFMWSWNDFFMPLIYINKTSMKTLSLGLMDYLAQATSGGFLDWGSLMAAGFMCLIPCLVIFFIAQDRFVEGIALTGIKG